MNDRSDDDLRARLRAADPAARLPSADPAEVDRLLQRVVDADLRETGTRRRNPLTWLVAAAAALVLVAAAAAFWLQQSGDDDGLTAGPTQATAPSEPSRSSESPAPGAGGAEEVSELTVAGAGAGRCMMPTPELVAGAEIAFEGTVEGVTDGIATLRTRTAYSGELADEVSVKGAVAPDTGGTIEGDPTFVAGQTYLVAARDGQVLGCGLSGPATAQLRDLYVQAFPR